MAPIRPLQPQAKPQRRAEKQAAKGMTRRRSSGKSAFWRQLIHDKLKTPKGRPCHSYFRPEDHMPETKVKHFYKDEGKICHFYGDSQNGREKTARIAIGKVLARSSLQDKVTITDAFRTLGNGADEGKTGKETEDLVNDTQLGALAGDAVTDDKHSEPASGRHTDESLAAVSQTLLAASPNCSGPPLQPSVKYLRAKKSRDRGQGLTEWTSPFLPCLNGKGHNKALLDNQITAVVWLLSRFFGKLPKLVTARWPSGLPTDATDRSQQDKLAGPELRGAILADSMGLGKTITTVALLSLLCSQGLNVIRESGGTSRHRPILLLAPALQVATQWCWEILQSTNPGEICRVITSGDGMEKAFCAPSSTNTSRLTVLTSAQFKEMAQGRDEVWDQDDPRSARTIMVFPLDTWARRTVFTHGSSSKSAPKTFESLLAASAQRYSVVVVDEAHRVKNQSTRLWKSIDLLTRRFTLLVTATPCLNTIADFYAVAALLSQAPADYVANHSVDGERGLKCLDVVEGLEPSDPQYLLAGYLPLVGELTNHGNPFKLDVEVATVRKYLKFFEKLAILQRAPTSSLRLDFTGSKTLLLKGLFPKVRNQTALIEVNPYFLRKYHRIHCRLTIDYLKALKLNFAKKDHRQQCVARVNRMRNKDKRTRNVTDSLLEETTLEDEAKIHLDELVDRVCDELDEYVDEDFLYEEANEHDTYLQVVYTNYAIAASSLDCWRLRRLLTKNGMDMGADNIALLRRNGITLIELAEFLWDRGREKKAPNNIFDYVALAVRMSPVLRHILAYIKDEMLDRAETEPIKKLLITEDVPALAFYTEVVLQFLGLRCRTLHAGLTAGQRYELVESFNSKDPNSCQILILMYRVGGAAGSNLHHACSSVIVASQSYSARMQGQAVHRVIRFGQEKDVQVRRVLVDQSWHAFMESRQVEKLLPELSSRAQQGTNDDLVSLLNLMRQESYSSWETSEAEELMETKQLLTDKYLQDLSTRAQGSQDADLATMVSRARLGWRCSVSSYMDQNDAFLAPATRREYYQQYRDLDQNEKLNFDHGKNALRRLMMHSSTGGSRSNIPYTHANLSDAYTLERALELLIRIQLGTTKLSMLPLPMIQLLYVEQEDLDRLAKELEALTKFECDDDDELAAAGDGEDIGGADDTSKKGDLEDDDDINNFIDDSGVMSIYSGDESDEGSDSSSDTSDEDDEDDQVPTPKPASATNPTSKRPDCKQPTRMKKESNDKKRKVQATNTSPAHAESQELSSKKLKTHSDPEPKPEPVAELQQGQPLAVKEEPAAEGRVDLSAIAEFNAGA